MISWTVVRIALALAAIGLAGPEASAWIPAHLSRTYDVGPVNGVAIDGDLADWTPDAFRIKMMASKAGRVVSPDDHHVSVVIGHHDDALLLGVSVHDDVVRPEREEQDLLPTDSVLLRISDRPDSGRFLIATISADGDASVDSHSTYVAEIQASGRSTPSGYDLEIQVPLGGLAASDQTVALQLKANDRDEGRDRSAVVWFPWDDLAVGQMAHQVRLAERSDGGIPGVAHGSFPDLLKTQVDVTTGAELAGRRVTFKDGDDALGEGVLEASGGLARATVTCEMPELGDPFRSPVVEVEGAGSIDVMIPDADERRAWQFTWHRIRFLAYAFSGPDFPRPVFEAPMMAEHLIGPYEIDAEYYDRNYNRVDRPTDEGRYGAVVIVATEAGRTYRRFRTLYKYSGFIPWWEREVDATIDIPDEFGIDPAILDSKRSVVADQLKIMFWQGLSRDQRIGSFLAGLRESVPGEVDEGFYDRVWERDREWWVGLKRRLYEMDGVEPVKAPVGVFKGRARELVMATEQEAGFSAGLSDSVQAVCDAWLEASGEPFTVCIARGGKIAHLQSYGFRDGRPVTLNSRAPIASITKLLTGVQVAILIDQKRVDPDLSVAEYLPAFESVPGAEHFTVRRLMNHTSGLDGHWGDEDNDFEEQIAGYLPNAMIGKTYLYNGTGFAIAGKVIEAVSGETLPGFLRAHVLEPLGCEDTYVSGTSQDGQSTALDLARIGQLLLNGGAYGDFRFFEYEAMQEFLPRSLSEVLPDAYREYGLGSRRFPNEGLSEATFGHGASSGTIFRVDPENDLVVTVSRWRPGSDYEKHKRKLFETIVSHIPEAASAQ